MTDSASRYALLACIFVLFLLSGQSTNAQPEAEIRAAPEQLCDKVLCRTPATIRLNMPEGQLFEMTPLLPTPIVVGNLFTVYAGETVRIEATVQNQRLTNFRAVNKVIDPQRTLIFYFKQEPGIGDGTEMILQVQSPFAGVLKYRLGMMLPTGDALFQTSACPLHGGITAYEHWRHPIFQIVAADFRFVDPDSDAATTCE
jgi:hypothetical protein